MGHLICGDPARQFAATLVARLLLLLLCVASVRPSPTALPTALPTIACTTSGCTSSFSPNSACASGSICISTSATSIGSSAFNGASSLTRVSFAGCSSLLSIDYQAFYQTTSLASVDLGGVKTITSIGQDAFRGASSLRTIDLTGCTSLASFGEAAFYGTTQLSILGRSTLMKLTTISTAFWYSSIKSLDLSGLPALKTIDYQAFYQASSLVNISFSGCTNLTSIGQDAFRGASSLRTIDLTGCTSLASFGEAAFYGTKLTSMRIPASVTTIVGYAFGSISTLTFVCWEGSMPASVDSNAFSGSSGITLASITTCPTYSPTAAPSGPTAMPSLTPTVIPTLAPTAALTSAPTASPSVAPTVTPTALSTASPSAASLTLTPSTAPATGPAQESTSQPSSQPSSHPTSKPSWRPSGQPSSRPSAQPTRLDLRTASIFSHPSKELIFFKVDYFLGTYAAFFVLLFILLLALDKSKWKKNVTRKLAATSYESARYRDLITVDTLEGSNEGGALRKLLLWSIIADEEAHTLKERTEEAVKVGGSKTGREYDGEFYLYLLSKRTYFGCKPLCYPFGYTFFFFELTTRGLLEDALLFIHNYHKIASCVFAIKGSPYSRTSRRIVFIMQHILTLSLLALSNDFFVEAPLASLLCSTVAIPTISIAVNIAFRAIITSKTIRKIGRTATVCVFLLGGMVLLTFAAMASSASSRFSLIAEYSLKVFVISALQDLLLIMLLFYHRMYLTFYIGRFPVFCIGKYYVEKLLHNRFYDSSEKSGDLVAVSYSIGPVTVEWAFSKKGTMEAAATAAAAAVEASEMAYVENPLRRRLSRGSVAPPVYVVEPFIIPHPSSHSTSTGTSSSSCVALTAHTVNATANPLLSSGGHRLHARANTTAVEECDEELEHLREEAQGRPRAGLHDGHDHDTAELREERLQVTLKRFDEGVSRAFAETVHFFQAREQGAIGASNIDEADMAAIEEAEGVAGSAEGGHGAVPVVQGRRRSVAELSRVFEGVSHQDRE